MRYASIDLLRTLAIGLMVVVHFTENLSGVGWAPAGFGAPLFALLAGLSFRIWVRSQEAKGVPDDRITRTAVRRGLFLFALGFAFNVLVWLPEDTFNWDVLTMIGTTFVLLAVGRRLPPAVLATVAGTFGVLSPFLRAQADYVSYWPDDYFRCEWTLSEVTIGYLATGYFPLFPWAAFPIAGYLAGRVMFPDAGEGLGGSDTPHPVRAEPSPTSPTRGEVGVAALSPETRTGDGETPHLPPCGGGRRSERSEPGGWGVPQTTRFTAPNVPSVKPVAMAGGVFLLLAVAFELGHRLLPAPLSSRVFTGWTMFPASPGYVCGTLGGSLLGFALLHHWVDRRNLLARWPAVTAVAGTMSRHSLSVYLLHHALHLWPLWVYGAVAGDEPTAFWRQALPAWAAVTLVPVCLVVCYLLFRGAERWKWPTTEGLMRWMCD